MLCTGAFLGEFQKGPFFVHSLELFFLIFPYEVISRCTLGLLIASCFLLADGEHFRCRGLFVGCSIGISLGAMFSSESSMSEHRSNRKIAAESSFFSVWLFLRDLGLLTL